MNILIITPFLNLGGEEINMLRLGEKLLERGHIVYWMSSGGPLIGKVLEAGIRYVNEKILSSRSLLHIFIGGRNIEKILKKYDIEIVHTNQVLPALMVGWSKMTNNSNKKKIVYLYDAHGTSNFSYAFIGLIFPLVFDTIIAVSYFEAKRLIKGKTSNKLIKVIYPGIDASSFFINLDNVKKKNSIGIYGNPIIIGCIGRLSWEKGQEYVIQAMPLVNDLNIKLLIIGGGELEQYYKDLARELNVLHNILFLGFRNDIAELLSIINICIIPSVKRKNIKDIVNEMSNITIGNLFSLLKKITIEFIQNWEEAFGLTSLEAMASGKLIIASQVGGLPEQIENGVNGFLIPSRDSESIAEKIRYSIVNSKETEKMGEKAKEVAKDLFDIELYVSEIERLYSLLLGRKP